MRNISISTESKKSYIATLALFRCPNMIAIRLTSDEASNFRWQLHKNSLHASVSSNVKTWDKWQDAAMASNSNKNVGDCQLSHRFRACPSLIESSCSRWLLSLLSASLGQSSTLELGILHKRLKVKLSHRSQPSIETIQEKKKKEIMLQRSQRSLFGKLQFCVRWFGRRKTTKTQLKLNPKATQRVSLFSRP